MAKIYAKLAAIQAALKAPKTQFNKFGGYPYRKAEDILEAVKPHLAANGCTLTCDDTLLLVGSRYYIKATATLTCVEDGSTLSTSAFAREEEEKKGMDGSQVTGASSSYARKYALNGLLCIDDTADSDTTNVGDTATPQPKKTGKAGKSTTAAPAQADNTSRVSTLSPEGYAAWVQAIALNMTTKKGLPAGQDFVNSFKPTKEEMEQMEVAVVDYKINNNLK